MNTLKVCACTFIRKEGDKLEIGLMINSNYLLIDMQGDFVKTPDYWELQPFLGVLNLNEE